MLRRLTLTFMFYSLPSAAFSETFEDYVISQLRCDTLPSPLPVLIALADAGLIDPNDNRGYDSLSCFIIHGGIELRGLRFTSICAHEERAEVRDQRPDLLYRGPGTSPGQILSFGTTSEESEVYQWYRFNIGTRLVDKAVSELDIGFVDIFDTVAVDCSSWTVD